MVHEHNEMSFSTQTTAAVRSESLTLGFVD